MEIQDAKITQNRHLRAITPLCMSYIFATKALIDNWKKLLSSNITSRCPHNIVKFGPLTAEIGSGVWGTPANFNGFRVLALLLQRCHLITGGQPNLARRLSVSWAGTLFIHFRELLPPDGILPGAKFTLCPKSCVLLYWQRYCTALEQPASAKICGVLQGMELRNFRRGRHLYSTGRPSRWASAHILVAFERNSQWKFFSKRYGV